MGGVNHEKMVVYYCYTHIRDESFWVSFADEMLPTLLAELLKKFLPRQIQYIN